MARLRKRLLGLQLLVATVLAQPESGPSITTDAARPAAPPAPTVQPTCEARTVNYITHTLPQQCLTSAPTPIASGPSEPSPAVAQTASSRTVDASAADGPGEDEEEHELDGDGNDLSTGAFMSFEEWRAMMLQKNGQENLENRPRKPHDGGRPEAYGEDYDTIGDEGEISLDFGAYSDKISEITSDTKPGSQKKEQPPDETVEKVAYDEGLGHVHRSKDAGKTCKERFNYASFDAGATVLKTSAGSKNPKAILVENKDSYMLMECGTRNKYFIIELSDDILVDTVVLANFEFFSSMIRKFRVSVSDRYPVKQWKVLGEYQARNSRDIQPFLIENPQIWARYLRIEILSHYGKEYYCPLSLIRLHGTRMLDSWKEADPSDAEAELEPEAEAVKAPMPTEETAEAEFVVEEEEELSADEPAPNDNQTATMLQTDLVPYWDGSYFHHFQAKFTCALDEEPEAMQDVVGSRDSTTAPVQSDAAGATSHISPAASSPATQSSSAFSSAATPHSADSSQMGSESPISAHVKESASAAPVATESSASNTTQVIPSKTSSTASTKPSSHHVVRQKTPASTSVKPPSSKSQSSKASSAVTSRNKTVTVTSSSVSASPTVQDSFFKQLTKRLQTLESNTTLSLQYIESQSRFLQEALSKLERRHVSKVDLFLETLNKTVLAELREVRTQYDQIWQSTVIALETQHERSEREIVALTGRLNLLADELVFQKRMAIAQGVLILGCVIIVVFFRGLGSLELEPYYPRFGSPLYPSTPKRMRSGERRNSTSLRESIEGPSVADPGRLAADHDINAQRPREGRSQALTPESELPRRRYSLPDNDARPSPPRAISETTGRELYQPPTPASLDDGYDSEPPNLPSSPKGDYFSSKDGDENPPDGPSLDAALVNHDSTTPERELGSELDGQARNGARIAEYAAIGSAHHRTAARHPLSHIGSSRKPLPALPEDSD